jgi:hypothetical protein
VDHQDLGVTKTLDDIRQIYYWLQTRNDVEKCRQRDNYAASRGPPNQVSTPVASGQRLGIVREYSFRRSGSVSSERPRERMRRYRCGLFRQMAKGLSRPQPGGVDRGGNISCQFLLPLLSTVRATQ